MSSSISLHVTMVTTRAVFHASKARAGLHQLWTGPHAGLLRVKEPAAIRVLQWNVLALGRSSPDQTGFMIPEEDEPEAGGAACWWDGH